MKETEKGIRLLEAIGYTGFVRLRPGKTQKCFACQQDTGPLTELQVFRSFNGVVEDLPRYTVSAERKDMTGHHCGPNHVTCEYAMPDIESLETLFRISDEWAQARGYEWEDTMQEKGFYACILRAHNAGIRATAENRYDARFNAFFRVVFKIDLPREFFNSAKTVK